MGFDPLSLGVAAATAGLGGYLSGKDKQKAAQREADARNFSLAQGVQKQNEYAGANRNDFNGGMTAFSPEAQATGLATAQDARTAGNVGNMTQDTGAGAAVPESSSPAVRGEIAKRMLKTFQQSTDQAKAAGKLGGYGDQQLSNSLGVAQTGRDINTRNSQASLDASLIAPKADLAATASYRHPSPWGNILQLAGNMMGAYRGSPGAPGGNYGGSPETNPFLRPV